jgi:hypothetical protein
VHGEQDDAGDEADDAEHDESGGVRLVPAADAFAVDRGAAGPPDPDRLRGDRAGADRPGQSLDQHHQGAESEQNRGGPRRPPGGRFEEPVLPRRRAELSGEAARVAELGDGFRLSLAARHPTLFELSGRRVQVIAGLVDDRVLRSRRSEARASRSSCIHASMGSATGCLQS